ncbi:MAG TPA: dienelactone hydrolase family protein [Armatimonadota bacterium]|nr:dienelactone hydrolase family protein [Armatimonadota bacterium]
MRIEAELDRRALLKGAAAGVVGAGVAGAAVLEADPAAAQDKQALKDTKILTETVHFKNGDDTINGFLARPKAPGKHGAVILMPGIFGVTDYMKESTAQVAQAGLVGLCVDFYSRQGGAPKTDDFAVLREVVGKIPDRQILGDLQAGIDYLKKQGYTNGKYGVTGFCMGGRYTLLLAATSPDIRAASPYYGPVMGQGPDRMAAIEMTDKIKAAVQGHYGANDMNPKPDDVRAFYEKLKATNPHGEFYIYEGAGHAFHDFSRPSYNAAAASQAWGRTLEFFQKHLS